MKTYLFDLDGTLLDSIDLILKSFHHTARVQRVTSNALPARSATRHKNS